MNYQADIPQAKAFLYRVIKKQADEKAIYWLEQQTEKLQKEPVNRNFFLAFSTASRFFSKKPLHLSEEAQVEAEQVRKGFRPQYWNLLQAARAYLLLHMPHNEEEIYLQTLDRIFETADMDEQVALYAALPLLPHPEALTGRASEGVRTNITAVFDAVALHNPYPADFLSDDAWNQMLLKAVFMQRPLYQIYGADERANAELARMLVDFAHERWAAHRNVVPELWHFVGPFLNEEYLPDIEKAVKQGEPLESEAALLACSQSGYSEARQILDSYPHIKRRIETDQLNWQNIGERYIAG